MADRERIGLIAGNGKLPQLFAQAAKEKGISVVAVAHQGETDPALESMVDTLAWVKIGQVDGIIRAFHREGIQRAAMAGGIGRVKAITDARPDLGALKIAARLRSFRDDSLLRAVADYFRTRGIEIFAPTDYLAKVLALRGRIAGPALNAKQQQDIAVGLEVATALGTVDVGQTVVVREGLVLAVEAIEGTDEAIRRGGKLGGTGAVVVKLCKPGQDERFDLPAIGLGTLRTMKEVGAKALAVQAGKTLLLDAEPFFDAADREGIAVVGVDRTPPG
ncbi:MAG: LpxI family protein [Myxococcaceae bacterium]